MSREWHYFVLNPTPVPVPGLRFCESPDDWCLVLVMGPIDGKPPILFREDINDWCQSQKERCLLYDVLADFIPGPRRDWFGDLGKKENYVGRQKKPGIALGLRALNPRTETTPGPRASAILPRQYAGSRSRSSGTRRLRFHNCLIVDCRVAAVVDWEISTSATRGRRLAYALNQFADPGMPFNKLPRQLRHRWFPNLRRSRALCRAYWTRYFEARFLYWLQPLENACILHGVYARYGRQKSTEGGFGRTAEQNRHVSDSAQWQSTESNNSLNISLSTCDG